MLLKDSREFSLAEDGRSINGGSKIVEIINTALNASTFTAITTTKPCKQLLIGLSTEVDWYLSNVEAGTNILTIFGTANKDKILQINIGADPGTLFWAKAETGTPNLEVVVID